MNSGLGKKGSGDSSPEFDSSLPTQFKLNQNYPNPFNPTTKIVYHIPENADVTIKVYDMLGKEITTLVEEYGEAGRYEVEFDATGLPSGMYLYRIQAGNFTDTKMMILLR